MTRSWTRRRGFTFAPQPLGHLHRNAIWKTEAHPAGALKMNGRGDGITTNRPWKSPPGTLWPLWTAARQPPCTFPRNNTRLYTYTFIYVFIYLFIYIYRPIHKRPFRVSRIPDGLFFTLEFPLICILRRTREPFFHYVFDSSPPPPPFFRVRSLSRTYGIARVTRVGWHTLSWPENIGSQNA